MKTKILLTISSLLMISLGFISCTDDDGDTTKPVITLNAPEEGATLKVGSNIHFDMDLEDNEELRSYKVEIHNNFDNHGHGTKAENTGETVPFSFNRSWDVSGIKNTHAHHHDIIIPADATHGAYHFMVYCTDAAGNESYVVRNIVLSDEGHDGHHD